MEYLIYLAMVALSFILPMIPASIAKSKHRSYWLFYVLGMFFWVPMIVIAICLGDKYDDESVNGRGIVLLLMVAITVYLTPILINFNDSKLIIWMEKNNLKIQDVSTAGIIVLSLLVIGGGFLIALIAGVLVALILWKPITFIAREINESRRTEKNQKVFRSVANYNGKNVDYVKRLNLVIPVAKKYQQFFKKRDKLAKYEKLNLGRVLKIALPIPIIVLYALSPISASVGGSEGLLKIVGILFLILVLLAKPIAMLKYRKSLKLDAIDAERGYTASMREIMPEIQPTDLRYRILKDMRIIFKMDLTNDIDIASQYAHLLAKGKSMSAVIALASVSVIKGKAAMDYKR